MKTYNQFLETPFSEEVKPPEPQEEDPQIASKEKRQKQIKKMVLLKKLQAVRAGAGADIVASHTPEGEMVEDYYRGTGEKVVARTKKWMDKKGQKGAPGLDAMKARTAEHKAKRGVKEEVVDEGKKKGLWDNIHAKRKRGEKPAKPGDKDYPKTLNVEDKAFEYVKKQIAAKYGKSGYVSKDNPRKPQTDADKAKVRAHQAKVDKENAAARAKDPSQGRYPKG